MEYLSIRELAAKFAMPERTVYYQINHTTGIRSIKRGRKKMILVSDFAKACGKELPWVAPINPDTIKKANNDIDNARLQKLQEQNRLDKEKIFALEKVNTNLETARNKFVQLYTDEKKEKSEVREKLDSLQEQYHLEIQTFMRKYHFALAVVAVCVSLLLALNIQVITAFLGL